MDGADVCMCVCVRTCFDILVLVSCLKLFFFSWGVSALDLRSYPTQLVKGLMSFEETFIKD